MMIFNFFVISQNRLPLRNGKKRRGVLGRKRYCYSCGMRLAGGGLCNSLTACESCSGSCGE